MKIKTRNPVRVNFGNGGDTDYYLKEMGIGWGCVVNTTLSSLYFECELELGSSTINYYLKNILENTEESESIQDLKIIGDKQDFIKALISYMNPSFKGNIKITTNVPKESGLGGSSSLMVALLHAFNQNKEDPVNPEDLARSAYHIERNILNIAGGYQDQWAAAYGRGINLMIFKNKRVQVIPLNISEETLKELEERSLLVYTGKKEISGNDIHKDQEKTIQLNSEEIKKLLIQKRSNAIRIAQALEEDNLNLFPQLIEKDWEIKQHLSNKLNSREDIYTTAISNGALAGRLCGAGTGTYYFFCEKGKKQQVIESIKSLISYELPFKIQRSNEEGTWHDHKTLYSSIETE